MRNTKPDNVVEYMHACFPYTKSSYNYTYSRSSLHWHIHIFSINVVLLYLLIVLSNVSLILVFSTKRDNIEVFSNITLLKLQTILRSIYRGIYSHCHLDYKTFSTNWWLYHWILILTETSNIQIDLIKFVWYYIKK